MFLSVATSNMVATALAKQVSLFIFKIIDQYFFDSVMMMMNVYL